MCAWDERGFPARTFFNNGWQPRKPRRITTQHTFCCWTNSSQTAITNRTSDNPASPASPLPPLPSSSASELLLEERVRFAKSTIRLALFFRHSHTQFQFSQCLNECVCVCVCVCMQSPVWECKSEQTALQEKGENETTVANDSLTDKLPVQPQHFFLFLPPAFSSYPALWNEHRVSSGSHQKCCCCWYCCSCGHQKREKPSWYYLLRLLF